MTKFLNLNKEKQEMIIFDKPGKYLVYFHNLSGRFTFEIKSSGVELDIFGLFTGKNMEQFKLQTLQRHCMPNSHSNLLIKGVFDDQSKLSYEGLIRIEKEAKKSVAYQNNRNLILSKDVFIESKPYLEILSDDVVCGHGSATSSINKDEIYYLKSRGIKENDAEKLLVEGFINEMVNKIQLEVPEFYV